MCVYDYILYWWIGLYLNIIMYIQFKLKHCFSELLLELDGSPDSDVVSLVQHQSVDLVSVQIQTDAAFCRSGLQVSGTRDNMWRHVTTCDDTWEHVRTLCDALSSGTMSELPVWSCQSAAAASSVTSRWSWRAVVLVTGGRTVSVRAEKNVIWVTHE